MDSPTIYAISFAMSPQPVGRHLSLSDILDTKNALDFYVTSGQIEVWTFHGSSDGWMVAYWKGCGKVYIYQILHLGEATRTAGKSIILMVFTRKDDERWGFSMALLVYRRLAIFWKWIIYEVMKAFFPGVFFLVVTHNCSWGRSLFTLCSWNIVGIGVFL